MAIELGLDRLAIGHVGCLPIVTQYLQQLGIRSDQVCVIVGRQPCIPSRWMLQGGRVSGSANGCHPDPGRQIAHCQAVETAARADAQPRK